jgi:hypothetical protein
MKNIFIKTHCNFLKKNGSNGSQAFLKYLLPFVFLFMINNRSQAQLDALGFGFRAGLSLAKIDGPSELGPNGEALETNKMATGFHIGVQINYKFGDLMGLRSELLYSQRGTDYLYEGPSYYVLGRNTVKEVTLLGTRKQSINVSNAYLDIPFSLYYKIKKIEISGGLNVGVLISSSAGGTIDFQGTTPVTSPFRINLNYNYKSDEAGEGSPETEILTIQGQTYPVPKFVGAYYEFPAKDKDLYKTLDLGLIAGLSYFLNEGLYLGVHYVHGLGDVDRNEYDVSLKELNTDASYIQRSDENKSRSWQFSVGFTF